jgi:HEAT repeat protein
VAALGLLLAVSVPAAVAAHRGTARARAGSPAVAVPRLAAALQDADENVRAEAARGLEVTPGSAGAMAALVAAVGDPSALVRGRAARAVCASAGGRPPAGVATVSLLRALLESARESRDDEMPDARLVLYLASFGPSATPELMAALDDADFHVRWHAAAALMQLRHGARDAAPALRRAMDDPEWAVRNAAGRALEDVVDKHSVPLLMEAMTDTSSETRYHVARALARVGPGSAAAIPVLEAALRDEDWEVRMEAAWALAAIGPAAASTEPALLVVLRDPDPQVRASAAWALAGIGGSDAAVAALRQARRDEDRQAREAAAGALARTLGRAR